MILPLRGSDDNTRREAAICVKAWAIVTGSDVTGTQRAAATFFRPSKEKTMQYTDMKTRGVGLDKFNAWQWTMLNIYIYIRTIWYIELVAILSRCQVPFTNNKMKAFSWINQFLSIYIFIKHFSTFCPRKSFLQTKTIVTNIIKS